jgi:hypothetical protein
MLIGLRTCEANNTAQDSDRSSHGKLDTMMERSEDRQMPYNTPLSHVDGQVWGNKIGKQPPMALSWQQEGLHVPSLAPHLILAKKAKK